MFGPHHVTITGDVAVWTTAFATLALAGAALRALAQLAEARTDRHVQVLMHIFEMWNSPLTNEGKQLEAETTREGLAEVVMTAWASEDKKESEAAMKHLTKLLRVPDYFESLSVLIDVANIDKQIVGDIYKSIVIDEWDYWRLAIARLRDESIGGDRYAYTWFERLKVQMESVVDR